MQEILARLNIKKTLLILSLFVVVILLLKVWSSYSLYIINVSGSSTYTISKYNQNKTSRVTSIFNISFIPKDTDYIEISSGSMLTHYALLDKPWFSIKTEDIILKDQYELSKLGTGGAGCNIKLPDDSNTYSYNCFDSQSSIYRFANKKNSERINSTSSLGYIYTMVRGLYPGGLLSVDIATDSSVSVNNITPSGEKIKSVEVNRYHRYNLYSNSQDKMFILYDTQDEELLIFKNGLDGEVEKKSLKELSGTEDKVTLTGCSISNNQYACYLTINIDDGSDKQHESSPTEGILAIYKNSEINAYRIPYTFDDLCIDSNVIVGKNNDSLYSLDMSNPNDVSLIDNRVRSVSCNGTTTAYTKDSGVFQIEGLSSYLLFNIDRFSMSSISIQEDDSIIFNAYIKSTDTQPSDNKFHTFEINKNKPIKDVSVRIENILPYNVINLPIYDIDYDDEAIYINPQVSVISDHQTGQTIVDEDSLRNTKLSIENKLRSDGILDKLKLVYY